MCIKYTKKEDGVSPCFLYTWKETDRLPAEACALASSCAARCLLSLRFSVFCFLISSIFLSIRAFLAFSFSACFCSFWPSLDLSLPICACLTWTRASSFPATWSMMLSIALVSANTLPFFPLGFLTFFLKPFLPLPIGSSSLSSSSSLSCAGCVVVG
ncbi:MAG: hypothetical protein BYD32DRAFT_406607 [Podila humilis]|nr:MAG: hypothetical protein BYD32DRAFT_406607 [Podila humilis]